MAKRGADEAFDEPDHSAKRKTKRSRRNDKNNAGRRTGSISKNIPSETLESPTEGSTSLPPAKTISNTEVAPPKDDVPQQGSPEQQEVRSRKKKRKNRSRKRHSAGAEDAIETASADLRSQNESKVVPAGASRGKPKIEEETTAVANETASPQVDLADSIDKVVDEAAQNSTSSKKHKKKSNSKSKRKKTEETKSHQRWTASITGGRFLSQDPLLAQQDQ